jgi:hypothetical protein
MRGRTGATISFLSGSLSQPDKDRGGGDHSSIAFKRLEGIGFS